MAFYVWNTGKSRVWRKRESEKRKLSWGLLLALRPGEIFGVRRSRPTYLGMSWEHVILSQKNRTLLNIIKNRQRINAPA